MSPRWTVLLALFLAGSVSACSAGVRVQTSPSGPGVPRCDAVSDHSTLPSALVLLAQAVPTASVVPCLRDLPAGWSYGGLDATDRGAEFWLRSDRNGEHAAEIQISAACNIQGAVTEPARGDPVWQQQGATTSGGVVRRYLVVPGACVVQTFTLVEQPTADILTEVTASIDVLSRATVAAALLDYSDGTITLDPPGEGP